MISPIQAPRSESATMQAGNPRVCLPGQADVLPRNPEKAKIGGNWCRPGTGLEPGRPIGSRWTRSCRIAPQRIGFEPVFPEHGADSSGFFEGCRPTSGNLNNKIASEVILSTESEVTIIRAPRSILNQNG